MNGDGIFGGVFEIAQKALDLRSRRQRLIVSNLANADTPGYKAFDIHVEEALQKYGRGNRAHLVQTDPGHMDVKTASAGADRRLPVIIDRQVSLRGDGNTVDMEREMTNLAANSLMYKATAQVLTKKFQILKSVIQGGKR